MKRILHIAKDEKFIDGAISNFIQLKDYQNDFIIVSDNEKLDYIKRRVNKISVPTYLEFIKKKELYSKYNLIIFHSLDINDRQFLKKIPGNIPTLWIGWGFDYINLLDYSKSSFYSKISKSILNKRKLKLKFKFEKLVKRNYFVSKLQTLKFKLEVDKKIDFFSPVIEEDYLLIKNKWSSFKPKYVYWNYDLSTNTSSFINHDKVNGDNILLGNSASPFNNHFDVLYAIQKFDLNNSKIICPLNYGDNWYKDEIIKFGTKMFPDTFMPLLHFMEFEDYVSLIKSCSIGIFAHYRQQALGNIILLLSFGAKIFLYEKNPLYTHLKSKGFLVYKLEGLDQNSFKGLNESEIDYNKKLIQKRFYDPAYVNRTQLLLEKIFSDPKDY